MNKRDLEAWLDRDDRELSDSIASEIRKHVTGIEARGEDFYGYAILPGDYYDINNLVGAFNREDDIAKENIDDNYYRYSVDEWSHYELDEFPISNAFIDHRNSCFHEQHVKDDPENFRMDQFEIAHADKLLDTILNAMITLRHEGVIGGDRSFAVIWIPDSDHDIIYKSVKELNSDTVIEAFMKMAGY